MNTWPKMMYLHDGSLDYKICHSAAEAKELEAKGYDFTGWPERQAEASKPAIKVEPKPIVKEKAVIPEEEPVNTLAKEPEGQKEPKKYPFGRCPVCKKSMKNFDHTECGT